MNLNKKVRTKQKPTSNSTIDTNNTSHAQTTPLNHLFIKEKKTNHFKNTTINKYFCITSPKNTSPPTNSILSKSVYKIAYGNLDKYNHPNVNIVIPTVPIQDPTYKQNNHQPNNHQNIPSQIPSPLLIPKFSTATSNLQKSTEHQLHQNIDIANTKVVSDHQQTIPKNRLFLKKRSSRTSFLKLNNPTSTTLQINK